MPSELFFDDFAIGIIDPFWPHLHQTVCLVIDGRIWPYRIKSYEFEEKGFTFELPRILTLSDCAFRVMFTKYDHYSPRCKTYLPRIKVKGQGEY